LLKNPLLIRQKELLGIQPKVSLSEGVKRVCQKVKERLAQKISI